MDMTVADLVDAALSAHDSQWHERADAGLRGLFGGPKGRYESRALGNATVIRAPRLDQDGVPFAALIHPDNPTSGAYGGMSVVLFPIEPGRALVALVVGTSGLADDAHVLGRPGHARKVRALTNWLNSRFGNGALIAWAKTDPTRIDQTIPTDIASRFEGCQSVFSRYGHVIYGFALITTDAPEIARQIITAVFDMYMSERQVALLRAFQEESRSVQAQYLAQLLPAIQGEALRDIILRRRYVILEGPPGTGKTRLAQLMLKDHFNNCGMSIQFHPNTTYQEFVGGLAPETSSHGLGIAFKPRPGVLMEAARAALADAARPYLLHIDEINRADLAKVLGEAIYLLEPMTELPRRIRLSFDFGPPFFQEFYLPDNLFILGTMNSADRSIAIVDIAVRRRFGFVKLLPQASVVSEHGCPLASDAFNRLVAIFVEHASDEAFNLVPGHSYFLVPDQHEVGVHLNQNLVPLLEEYLAQGYVAAFAEEIRAYLQWVESLV